MVEVGGEGVDGVGACAGAGGHAEAGVAVGGEDDFEEGGATEAELELGCEALALFKHVADGWFVCGDVDRGLGRIWCQYR